MKRIAFVAFALAIIAPAAWAEKIGLTELSNYLNKIQSAKGEFTQINDDGTITTGTIYIKRPGRMRFEYAPPDNSLVIAGGGQVAIFDPKSNVAPEQFPLSRTPLGLILARNVDLRHSKMLVNHKEVENATVVTVQDPKHPEYGNMELKFTGNPVQLRQWIITNDVGAKTTVILGALEDAARIRSTLFNIPQEIERRGN